MTTIKYISGSILCWHSTVLESMLDLLDAAKHGNTFALEMGQTALLVLG